MTLYVRALRHPLKLTALDLLTHMFKGSQNGFNDTLTVDRSGKSIGGQGVLDLRSFKGQEHFKNRSFYLLVACPVTLRR